MLLRFGRNPRNETNLFTFVIILALTFNSEIQFVKAHYEIIDVMSFLAYT